MLVKANTKTKKGKIILGVIYRHPSSKYDHFCEKFCNQLLTFNEKKMKYIVVGDFNIDLNKYNIASNVTGYLNAIHSVGCNAFIDKPTRISSHGGSCIDHVYSNLACENVNNFIVEADISDHYGTLSLLNSSLPDQPSNEVFYRKSSLSDAEWEAFNLELGKALEHIHGSFISHDPNVLAKEITQTYVSLIEKYMPLKKISNKRKRNPD